MAQSSDGKKLFICNFCEKVIKEGGLNRIKCYMVSNDVCFQMNESLKELAQ